MVGYTRAAQKEDMPIRASNAIQAAWVRRGAGRSAGGGRVVGWSGGEEWVRGALAIAAAVKQAKGRRWRRSGEVELKSWHGITRHGMTLTRSVKVA